VGGGRIFLAPRRIREREVMGGTWQRELALGGRKRKSLKLGSPITISRARENVVG